MKSSIAFLTLIVFLAVHCYTADADCKSHRERELKASNPIVPVPECEENGDYKPLSCTVDGSHNQKYCMCYTKDGQVVKSPSNKIESCACHVHRHEKLNSRLIGAFVPTCKENGKYEKVQCHGSTGLCWCADEDGNRVSKPKHGSVQC